MAELLDEIAAGKLAPVYFVCGEAYPRDQVVSALRNAVLGGKESAFNFDGLDAKAAGPVGILSAARTLPMFGTRRLVLVRDADELAAEALNQLLPYVKDPNPSTCLVFVAEKADLRLKFFSAVKEHGVLVRFEPLKDRQAPAWLQSEARRQKLKLEPGAAERIAEAVGTDMAQLASALERLSLYVGDGKPIAASDAEELLAQTRQRSIFELTNAVGRGQRREALLVLRQMLLAREPAVRVVAMLARHLRQLWQARELARARSTPQEIASRVGMHPFFVADLLAQAERFDGATLERTHRALYEADRTLKSSPLADALVLDQLVLALCPAETESRRSQVR
ncbi:MAG: DNA polymerase III subunit delta [Deltaproteobacteria bacterium]|nr:DNA polymerase III subunit delta [Deltaproteobacteria bacterium]